MKALRTGLLLAGGRSVRMGRDKALLPWLGRPLWQWQAELMKQAGVQRWILSCRREQQLEAEAGAWALENGMILEVLFDADGAAGGMLEALENGLRAASGQTLVLSVDMPQVTAEILECLWQAADSDGGCLLTGERGVEPFPGLYVPAMLHLLVLEGRPLKEGLQECLVSGLARTVSVPPETDGFLANWNRPGDVVN